jgi:hypothetical protein
MPVQAPCLIIGCFENCRATHSSLGGGDDGEIFTGYAEEDFHDDDSVETLGNGWRILELSGV